MIIVRSIGREDVQPYPGRLAHQLEDLAYHLSDRPVTILPSSLWVIVRGWPHSALFIAQDGARVVGMVTYTEPVRIMGTRAWLEDLVVHPDYRRRGVATRLMGHATGHAWAMGMQQLRATSSRPASRRMLAGLGWLERDSKLFQIDSTITASDPAAGPDQETKEDTR